MDEFQLQAEYKIVKTYNCAVTILGGHLHICRLLKSGDLQVHSKGPNWVKVRPPVGQPFLAAVNAALGTSYKESDFRLEKKPAAVFPPAKPVPPKEPGF